MTTISSPKSTAPRRPPSASPTPTPSIARGATARSAASPRVASSLNSGLARQPSTKTTSFNEHAREALVASLKVETDQKEQLLVQLQDKDQTIVSLTAQVENLTSTLHTTEARLNELYTEQSRSEAELAQRIDIAEKLRTQIRELEKERRDLQRRYNEQTTTFEAERQAFYDNEQHLKSRIQSLNEAWKRAEEAAKQLPEQEIEVAEEQEATPAPKSPVIKQDVNDPENEPAEMTALKLELSTLSTSYSSLQSTLVLLQSQLMDIKRVNNELQEENESYMILLREKTLNGQFDLNRQVGTGSATSEDDGEESDDNIEHADVGSLHSFGRSTLDRVDEEAEAEGFEGQVESSIDVEEDIEKPRFSRHSSRQGRKRTNSTHETRGESLADLPITGPGLDLAAELGRAENKDILEDAHIEDQGILNSKGRRGKKLSDGRKTSDSGQVDSNISAEMETMRSEIKSLKDANKALSLYASKIIDRIIAQEGFEHVLAVDYDKAPPTPSASSFNNPVTQPSPAPAPKPRPQSLFAGRGSFTPPTPAPIPESRLPGSNPTMPPPTPMSNPKANRRSLSFDWRGFSLFNNAGDKKADPSLRPLTLKPGLTTLSGARKLDTEEDEEDRKERERLNATMKLMGIQPSSQAPSLSPSIPIERSHSDNGNNDAAGNRRFSFFGFRGSTDGSDGASVHSVPAMGSQVGLGITGSASLTQEALEHAEAESSLAALDAHERNLSAELAKGGSGGFTEIAPRQGRRSKRSAGDSGSTVWSAGMSTGDD